VPEPLYFLGAAPTAQVRVLSLTRAEGVRQQLENPPQARQAGWNLLTYERAELMPGPRLHIQNGERKFFDLHEDATFTAIAAIEGFLGHGRWDFSTKPLINGLALVEFTYEFVSFYERLLHEHLDPRPDGVRFTVGLRNAFYDRDGVERKLLLASGPVGDWYGFMRDPQPARTASFTEFVDSAVTEEEPHIDTGRVSYELVRRVFNAFGFTDDAVPYTNQAQDAIDFDQIRNMDR
jgi:hypothetical protein